MHRFRQRTWYMWHNLRLNRMSLIPLGLTPLMFIEAPLPFITSFRGDEFPVLGVLSLGDLRFSVSAGDECIDRIQCQLLSYMAAKILLLAVQQAQGLPVAMSSHRDTNASADSPHSSISTCEIR